MIVKDHAKDRVFQRIAKTDITVFVKAIEKEARKGHFYGFWAIKVVQGSRVLGYAVGRGKTWETTLSPGQTPERSSDIRVVRL